jgi:predicted permease
MWLLADLRQDLRYAVRNLRHQKAMSLMAVLSLSLGISMVTTMYSQIESTMLRDVPGVAAPAELALLQRPVAFPDYERMRDAQVFLDATALIPNAPVMLAVGQEQPDRRFAHIVTTNYFAMLGATASRGRTLGTDDRSGSEPAMVISNRLWVDRFGSDPAIVGRNVRINGKPVTVVGVAQPGFQGSSPMMAATDIWLPVTISAEIVPEVGNGVLEKRIARFQVLGRLAPGTKPAQAEAALDALMRNIEIETADPGAKREGRRVTLLPGGRIFPVRDEDFVVSLAMPLVLIGLMLWIACANVATMILAKSLSRRKEIGIRLAVGASRGRLIRQLLTESAVLAVLGGILGIGWAQWSTGLMDLYRPVLPGYVELSMSISWRALVLTLAVSILTGILFGLTPALQATRTDLSSALKGALGPVKSRWWSPRNILVMQQVAASLTLLMLTGFIVVGFNRSSGGEAGFDPRHLYQFSLDPLRDGYSPERTTRFFQTIVEEVRGLPGIERAALAEKSPMSLGQNAEMMSSRSSFESMRAEFRSVRVDRVGPGFFSTAGIPMIHGREFREADWKSSEPLAVVNEEMARGVWADRDPVGEIAEIAGASHRIVGVAKTIRTGAILPAANPSAYLLLGQETYLQPLPEGITLLVRAQPSFDAVTAVTRAITTREAGLTVFQAGPVQQQMDNSRAILRVVSYTYGAIGLYGLLLSAVGLAGVTAQAVVRRTKEIGIRMALGARRGDIWRLVMREGFLLTLAGTVVGLAAALALTRVLQAFFAAITDITKTTLTDPLLLVGAPLLLFLLTLGACLAPSLRAIRIDPVRAIREE